MLFPSTLLSRRRCQRLFCVPLGPPEERLLLLLDVIVLLGLLCQILFDGSPSRRQLEIRRRALFLAVVQNGVVLSKIPAFEKIIPSSLKSE